jgi:hypothetical protein
MQQHNASPDSEDVLDVLCTEGAKGLARVLKQTGFATSDYVEAALSTSARALAIEQEVTNKYPDLQNQSSEFFRETARHYATLTRDGVPKALAMKLAAQQAELAGVDSGKHPATARAKTGANPAGADEPDDLDDFQKYICEALEVDPEKYKQRAKDGVRVGSR